MEGLIFALAASVLLGASFMVVLAKSPLRSAMALILAQVQMAVLYVLLNAPFVAAMQVLVYAGAVMVLFVFVIMLLNAGPLTLPELSVPLTKWLGAGAVVGVLGVVAYGAYALASPGMSPPMLGGVHDVGEALLGRFVFAFEATSLLLLTSVVGAIVLGMKRLSA